MKLASTKPGIPLTSTSSHFCPLAAIIQTSLNAQDVQV